MGLFDRLFGKKTAATEAGGKVVLTPEQLFATAKVQSVLARYRLQTVLLKPMRSAEPISPQVSKFGGVPNGNGFAAHPCCDTYDTPLNFVLQLYKTGFPQHYFPEGKNLFQVFRCPSDTCPAAFSAPYHSDRKLFIYYFMDDPGKEQMFALPVLDRTELEDLVPDCVLHPESRRTIRIMRILIRSSTILKRFTGRSWARPLWRSSVRSKRPRAAVIPALRRGRFTRNASAVRRRNSFFSYRVTIRWMVLNH